MRTEKEIKARLRETKKTLKQTEKNFEKYDNHDDMEIIQELQVAVEELGWVLTGGV